MCVMLRAAKGEVKPPYGSYASRVRIKNPKRMRAMLAPTLAIAPAFRPRAKLMLHP